MCEKCGFSGCKHDEARRERSRGDRLDAIIFDMMLENENPPDKDTLQKWIDQFPQFERELRGFVRGWRIMELRVTDQETNEVERDYQAEKRHGKKLRWSNQRKCDICGNRPSGCCIDGLYRCGRCLDLAVPEGTKGEKL